MARTPIAVDSQELQRVINELEEKHNFSNLSELYNAIAETEFAKNCKPRPLSAQVAMIRIKEYNLSVRTQRGQKGKPSGLTSVNRGVRRNRQIPLEIVQELRDNYKEQLGLVEKIAKGSLKAALTLKCIDCSGGSKKEVARCTITSCPLYGFRPYKLKAKQEEIADELVEV